MRPISEETDGEVSISGQSRHFAFVVHMIKVLFSICISTWRVKNYVSRQGKRTNRRNESTIIVMKYCLVPYNQFRLLFSLTNSC